LEERERERKRREKRNVEDKDLLARYY